MTFRESGKRPLFMLPVLILIGLNMRPLLTSIGPLLPPLRAAAGMSFVTASLLTALPVIVMGVLALVGGRLTVRLGERYSVALSLLLIAAGALLREMAPQSALLISSALLGGTGIGLIQTIVPAIIKRRWKRRMPQIMGLWSAALMGGGGLGAALTPWLAAHGACWYRALAWWALPAVAALAGWWRLQSCVDGQKEHAAPPDNVQVWRSPRAWLLGLYFGAINGGYASLIAWLPPYYIQLGIAPQLSGMLLALMTAGQTVGALALPLLAHRQDRRYLLMLTLVLQLLGFCGFIFWPLSLPALWAVICGVGLGGAFPLCLVLALDHAAHSAVAGRLVAFMQGAGFIIAGLSPWLSGLLRSLSGSYLLDWQMHALSVIALLLLTWRFAPARYPQGWQ